MSDLEGRPRILCVDDEPQILEGLSLHLRRHYDVHTAPSGAAGLEVIRRVGTLALIISDMRMPGMDGATFLGKARAAAPDSVRMLLTGFADLDAAIAAVNEGQVFRFLVKPCPPPLLLSAVDAAIKQHRLVTAEHVLLEQTLHGSIRALADVLALAAPAAFGRANRIKRAVSELGRHAQLASRWQVEMAALLSQIGCVMVPPTTADKMYHGQQLTKEEQEMEARLPQVAEQLIAHIPRLEDVRAILLNQAKRFDGQGPPANGLRGEEIPWGARALKIAIDYDVLEAQGYPVAFVLDTMRGRAGWYDPPLLQAFAEIRGSASWRTDVRELAVRSVRVGMIFVEDVRATTGALLVARGFEVTPSLIERIRNFSGGSVKEPVRVVVPPSVT